ncbi:Nucleotide-binding universal stress protein, UspA family [Nonomuraea maritima]|uniref:Nucleotide-binding universal stress protein, UspA family n=1 Tax=Nonomuraea maritima TaxID=683260 RepID=A0A1G9BD08_9ACTN|nr:universal stress protein [Nonomuraea maritima]SDK37371.1 Nucleotide-binding universal stress protein, UspA family [Nonomuraea maritima]
MAMDVIVGYDGSPAAAAAIDAGAALFPRAHVWITHLWTPPFASESLRRRLWTGRADISGFIEAIEREGEAEAHRLADRGARLARTAGWDAEPLVRRTYGGEGLYFAQLAQEVDADVVLVGSRGLGGTQAILGSVSDTVVHYTPRPVLVVPHPLLTTEQAPLAGGPVIVGWDGSAGAEEALRAAARLFAGRELIVVSVDGASPEDSPPPAEGLTVERVTVAGRRVMHGRAVADELRVCARTRGAAAVVVGSRGRSASREILTGSVAMATLHHTHRPVMVVPRPDRSST